jgi:hypothetical protein
LVAFDKTTGPSCADPLEECFDHVRSTTYGGTGAALMLAPPLRSIPRTARQMRLHGRQCSSLIRGLVYQRVGATCRDDLSRPYTHSSARNYTVRRFKT